MLKNTQNELTAEYNARVIAYTRVFDPQNQFTQLVLADLSKFCRANETTYHSDPRLHAALEGRREVWLRIQEYLTLTTEQILKLRLVKESSK